MCFDKYISQPTATTVSFAPNDGRYPVAVTFGKRLIYANISASNSLDKEPFEDLLLIEIEIHGKQNWSKVYENGTFYDFVSLSRRHFTSFSWSDNTFKLCFSFRLGQEKMKIKQMKITYKSSIYK
jgi:hypothetical protein